MPSPRYQLRDSFSDFAVYFLILHFGNTVVGIEKSHRWFPISRLSVIKHRGRTSGKEYETIVTSYRKGDVLAIGLAHGKTNWVKNVLAAGEADIHVARKDLHLVNPRILPAGTDDPSLPRIAQIVAKRSGVFVADIAH